MLYNNGFVEKNPPLWLPPLHNCLRSPQKIHGLPIKKSLSSNWNLCNRWQTHTTCILSHNKIFLTNLRSLTIWNISFTGKRKIMPGSYSSSIVCEHLVLQPTALLSYPHALHHLDLLQHAQFRSEIKKDEWREYLNQKQYDHWRTWYETRFMAFFRLISLLLGVISQGLIASSLQVTL